MGQVPCTRGALWLGTALLSLPLAAQHELVLRAPPGVQGAAMAFDEARGEAILFGGRLGTYGPANDRTFAWDGTAWRELHPANRPSARWGHCMAYDAVRQRIVLFGGQDPNLRGDTWQWDGTDWTAGPLVGPPPRSRAAMAYHASANLMLLFGGGGSAEYGDAWAFDGTSWQQIPFPAQNLPYERAGHSMVYDAARQTVVLFGGDGYSHLANGDVWELGPAGLVRIPTTGPTPRVDAALIDVPGIGVLLHGGSAYSGGLALPADTWTWDGSSWTPVNVPKPEADTLAAACFDSVRGEALLWGGGVRTNASAELRSSLWAFQGVWTERAAVPLNSPAAATCFDAVRGEAVNLQHSPWGPGPQTTWIGTATGWTRMAPLAQPPARLNDHDLVCDRARQVCLMFSGRPVSAPFVADTWEWNGSNWMAANPPVSPSAREQHGLAYDRARQRIVLFGGINFPGGTVQHLNDTWEYDGATWHPIATGPSPSPRRARGAMAFDARTGTVVLAGGVFDSTSLTDTWRWDGALWTPVATANPVPGNANLIEDDDLGRITALAPQGQQFGTWDFTGTDWTPVSTLPGAAPRPFYDTVRGRIGSVGSGDLELTRPKASHDDPGNPIALACTGRPELGSALSLTSTVPVAFAIALANAVVPGIPLTGAPWCPGTVLDLAPAQAVVIGGGTNLLLPIPVSANLIDQPLCCQAGGPNGPCLSFSNTWVLRIQAN